MAVRYICDRCGETDQVGRFGLNPCISQPHHTGDYLPKFDGELCSVCLRQVCGMIKEALASKRRQVAQEREVRRKPIQFIAKVGFLMPQTYFVVCDDGKMFWAQPKHGKELQWIPIRDVPQDAALNAEE